MAVLDGFQAYMQARIAGEAVSWRAVIWQASEWVILGALTPITYHLGRRFPLRRLQFRTPYSAGACLAPDGIIRTTQP
jgi:hypothetical protein